MKLKEISLDDLSSPSLNLHPPTIPEWPEEIDTRKGMHPTVVAIDTETTGLAWSQKDQPFAVSLAWYDEANNKKAYDDMIGELTYAYYDFPVDPYTREVQYPEALQGLLPLASICRNPNILKVFANAKYDMHMLDKWLHIQVNGPIFDVLVAAWCCNTQEPSYKLNDLAEKYLGVDQSDQYKLREKVKQARSKVKKNGFAVGTGISKIPEDYWLLKYLDHSDNHCCTYALKDAGPRTLDLYYYYLEAFQQFDPAIKQAFDTEMELMRILFSMERRGIRFHESECIEQIDKLEKVCAEKATWIRQQLRNPELNLNSDKQLIPHFYKQSDWSGNGKVCLGLDVIEWTSGGKDGKNKQPSMSAETLKKIKDQDPTGVVQAKLDYDGHNTGIKYFRNYLSHATKDEYTSAHDLPHLHSMKAIHCGFNQISAWGDTQNKTATGRLSSSQPNLQNVADPEKSDAIVDGRAAFGPRNGYVWYCIDYSQLELRLFAERTKGKLHQAFLDGRDPHDETRRNVPFLAAKPTEQGRKVAKNTNFTIVNCGGANVLHKKYRIPLNEGKIVVKEFYEAFPETTLRQREAERFAIENGFIESITGRHINVDLTQKHGKFLYAYRATSYDIQGSAADIIKRAMIATHEFLAKTKYDARLVLSIHDELVFEIYRQHAYKKLIKALKSIMEGVAKEFMTLPLECEVSKTYTNWSTSEKIKVNLE